MSTIFSSTVNCSVFSVIGELDGCSSGSLSTSILETLRKFAFVDISEGTTEQSVGWAQVDDHNSVAFASDDHVIIDDYIFLRMRKDARKVPAAVLEREVKDLTAIWLEDHPQLTRPPKMIREDIKDKAKLSLFSKTLPIPKLLDAIWDVRRGSMYVLSASQGEIDGFIEFFTRCFEPARLVERVPFELASSAVITNRDLFGLLAAANRATSDHQLDILNSNTWIGENFLLWLLAQQADAAVPGVSIWIDDKLVVSGVGKKAAFTGTISEHMDAIRSALREGGKVQDARVTIERNDGSMWHAVVCGDSFRLKGVKCPGMSCIGEVDQQDDLLRTDMMLRVWSISKLLELLYSEFLGEFLAAYLPSGDLAGIQSFLDGEL